jgi:hypothetical protein
MQTATRSPKEAATGPTSIRFTCARCGHKWRLPAHWAGTRIYLDSGLSADCPRCPGVGSAES